MCLDQFFLLLHHHNCTMLPCSWWIASEKGSLSYWWFKLQEEWRRTACFHMTKMIILPSKGCTFLHFCLTILKVLHRYTQKFFWITWGYWQSSWKNSIVYCNMDVVQRSHPKYWSKTQNSHKGLMNGVMDETYMGCFVSA